MTLVQMAAEVRAGKVSPSELVQAHLAQIEKHNPALNAFAILRAEEAREAACAAEQALGQKNLGPLHGVPVTVKDSFDLAGLPTLCGSRFRLGHKAASDSTAASRLSKAGAIVLGKTNTPEFLMSYETDNHLTGRTNNPWDLERTPGGSSGGEAAAIAAFCSAGGVGSDGGGSVRIPAHFCGICALKPTPGRVPATGHFPDICHPGGLLGVAGPMARTAQDLRLLFAVLSGHEAQDPFSAPVPIRTPELKGLRAGVLEQFGADPVQADVRQTVWRATETLGELGIPAASFEPSGFDRAQELWWFFFGRLNAMLIRQVVREREDEAHWTGMELVTMAEQEPPPGAMEILENLAARDRMRAALLRQMEETPVLLLPACGVTAFRHRERRYETPEGPIGLLDAMAPATPWNLLGFPAVVIPFGMTHNGSLPVGIQIVGRPWEEELILEVAVRLEEARGPFLAPPGYRD